MNAKQGYDTIISVSKQVFFKLRSEWKAGENVGETENLPTREMKIRRILIILLIAGLTVLMIRWATLQKSIDAGPDEYMRYIVARFIYDHGGKLPTGFDAEVRDGNWGFSYAVYPLLASIVSAVYMKFESFFRTDVPALLIAARMASVTFLTIGAFFTFLAGEKLFRGWKGICFAVLVLYLPGFHYLGTYMNCDSLALMSVSIIFYAWVCALKDGWRWKTCITLAVGIGICALSYYNAYGWILAGIVYYFTLAAANREYTDKALFLKKTVVICLIVLGISGWWFIRNYFLYDGDFLGFRTARNLMEQYAVPGLKPSVRQSPAELGWSLRDLMWYQDPGWPHIWMKLVVVSFVGTFGYFNIYMKDILNRIYIFMIGIPLAVSLLTVRRFSPVQKKPSRQSSKEGIFNIVMLLAMCIPVFLFVWYAYFSDLQAQGRYMISAVYAVMYFVVCGFDFILEKMHIRNTRVFYMILTGLWIAGALHNFVTVILPAYR